MISKSFKVQSEDSGKMVKMILGSLLLVTNLTFLAYFWNCLQVRVPVLCFHRILENADPLSLWIGQPRFEEILNLLEQKGYKTILPGEDPSQDGKSVILTFDDGSPDHLDTVLPILNSRKMRGVFFWITNLLEKWDPERLQRLLIDAANHQHGSHSMTHYSILSGIRDADLDRLNKELRDSKLYLEAVFGKSVQSFAFPRGEVDTGGAHLASQFYTNLFSVEYGYYLPAFKQKIHGRFLVLKEGKMTELESYLDESNPFNSLEFPVISLLLVVANLFFWGRKKMTTGHSRLQPPT